MDLSSVPVQIIPSKSPRNSHLDWEDLSRRLLGKDLRDALQAGKELKDRIDFINPKLLSTKVTFLLPTFSSVLNSTCRPNNDSLSNENRLRNMILEILRRIPKDELFRTHAPTIFDLCMEVLSKDYEENALLASKIIFDLHKNYRSMPQDQVQPYLDFVHQIYRSLPTSVQKNFQLHDEFINPNPMKSQFSLQDLSLSAENDSSLLSPEKNDLKLGNSPSAEGQGNPPAKQGIESTLSFRVLTECPLTVMLLFQLYPKYLKSNIPTLIHLMMEALAIRLPPIQSLVKKENSKIENHHKRLYYNRSRELVSAQVKTLSFLTYLLRGFADLMKPYEDRIATNVISLMTSCPRESIGTRKELMVATRHILATDFRKGFFRHIDSLLDERILMGSHRHSDLLAMRPLGYSTLADLVHHVRAMLTIKQLSRVVSIFSRVLHDSSMNLPFSIQNTAVRLMLNVTDNIYNNKDPNGQVGRDLLDRIFASLVNKLETLQISMERIQKAGARKYTNSATNLDVNTAKVSSESNQVDINSNVHPKESLELRSESESHMERILFDPDEWMVDDQSQIDVKRDIQSMIRSIIIGLKTVIWYITNYRIPKDKEKSSAVVVDESPAPNVRFSALERDLIEKYIDVAIPCLEFFSRNQSLSQSLSNDSSSQNNSISSDQAEKDIVTYFATSFSVLDSVNLRRTLERKIGRIVKSIVKDSNMMLFPRHLMGINARTNADVCEILLTYLVDHILCLSTFHPTDFCFLSSNEDDIDNAETMLIKRREEAKQLILKNKSISAEEQETANNSAAIHLKLFEQVILSLSQFPENERILRPYLPKIVSSSLRLSLEKDDGWPDNYFALLRLIFRSISNGKFEESYIELLPMIPTILNGLYRIYQGTEDASLQDMIIELSLTIPARLSSLLPHIPLLLRMITASLKRSDGDLINLGLRTLEFWIDNVNSDFLHQILRRQTSVSTDLMTALSNHLHPAPYPHGHIALRILGKLGGRNRHFLRDEISLENPSKGSKLSQLSIGCSWSTLEAEDESSKSGNLPAAFFSIPMPLLSAVHILEVAAKINVDNLKYKHMQESNEDPDNTSLMTFDVVSDMSTLSTNLAKSTISDQASSAFVVIETALATLLNFDEQPSDLTVILSNANECNASDVETCEKLEHRKSSNQISESLKVIMKGLLLSLSIDSLEEQANICARGLFIYILSVISSFKDNIIKIDANGSRLEARGSPNNSPSKEGKSEIQGSLSPFGCFEFTGQLSKMNPFVICEAIADVISDSSCHIRNKTNKFLKCALKDFMDIEGSAEANIETKNSAVLAFNEKLLESLCRVAISKPWNLVSGLRLAILDMINLLGSHWAREYEVELVYTAFSSMKNAGREIPCAGVKAYQFFVSIFLALYGQPKEWTTDNFIPDVLAMESKWEPLSSTDGNGLTTPSDSVLNLIIIELASTKHLIRFAARHALKYHILANKSSVERQNKISSHMSTIKRVLFTRSLRLLPLPEQVAVIEALSTLVDFVPGLLPVGDQHLLAFLSEFLKLSSIADGEMSDSTIVGFVVDKNGFASNIAHSGRQSSLRHTTGLFLRRDCVAQVGHDKFILISEELPLGVQLRVSALRLVNTVICRHANGFFDAETLTPIGNIRPHVISLLFRSLVSEPIMAVLAAHDALQNVLSLSVVNKDGDEGNKSQSRLPKELLQNCIRPVLLNLRDYTRLTVPLLRGLARLLSLLSSWFNKTLGEKLLEHLQKWAEPESIVACNLWKSGDESIVAAKILDLFALLPHASHFVEPLVKTVIKLESVFHKFKSRHQSLSPYRKPLASYLNKYSQHAITFFFQRLKSHTYNELFQDIIAMEESDGLRSYLSGKQCSVTILNVCFERPLAIIRSEKAVAPGKSSTALAKSTSEVMSIHGIPIDLAQPRDSLLRQEIDAKHKKLAVLQHEASRTKEALQNVASGPENYDTQEEAKRLHRSAQTEVEKLQRELVECKQKYVSELALQESIDPSLSAKKMTLDSLEVQNQGLQILETLVGYNPTYLTDHNDIVRALRWLWRSKGRHLRLQHEEFMPLRFHRESYLLGSLLVKYAKAVPNDVDVLFEVLRIFLQPTTCNFGFVKVFLNDMVVNRISKERKGQIMHRFFALISGEGPEETKVLSLQLIVIPMLLAVLNRSENVKTGKRPLNVESIPDLCGAREKDEDSLVDEVIIKKFVQEVLLKDGSSSAIGDRARVELLRLSTLFIRYRPFLMEAYRKDVIKFSWGLLNSDSTTCKSWAHLNVCSFIAAFETPGKVVLQVYCALLRQYQVEGRVCLRYALTLLLSALPKRVNKSEIDRMIEFTARLIQEESNNIPQLAHIIHIIISFPEFFGPFRNRFAMFMVDSLSKLGLAPNCHVENRALSLSIVETVLGWEDSVSNVSDDNNSRHTSHSSKRLKVSSGDAIDMDSNRNVLLENYSINLDFHVIDKITDFLVKFMFVLADVKMEIGKHDMERKSRSLFSLLVEKRGGGGIRSAHFENLTSVSLETAGTKVKAQDSLDRKMLSKSRILPKTSSKSVRHNATKSSLFSLSNNDEKKKISSPLLLVSLDIFKVIITLTSDFPVLSDNSEILRHILYLCFRRAKETDEIDVRTKLKDFLILFLTCERFHQRVKCEISNEIAVFLESYILISIDSLPPHFKSFDSSRVTDPGKESSGREPATEDEDPYLAFFSLDIIYKCTKYSAVFVNAFTGSLVTLCEKLMSIHVLKDARDKEKDGDLFNSMSSYSYERSPTPTRDIIEKAIVMAKCSNNAKHDSKYGMMQKQIILCIKLISSSDLVLSFSQNRQKMMKILGDTLDTCDDTEIVFTAVQVIGRWLILKECSCPLTLKERVMFLQKIASLGNRPIEPLAAHVISGVVGFLILKIGEDEADTSFLGHPCTSFANISPVLDSGDPGQIVRLRRSLLQGVMVANILNPHSKIRDKVLSLYLSFDAESNFRRSCDPSRELVFETLWQLFHSNFEGTKGRMWTLVFVEVLIKRCLQTSLYAKTENCSFPHPNRPRCIGSTCFEAQKSLGLFHKHLSQYLLRFEASRARLITSILHLAHGDVELSQSLFESVLSSAWSYIENDEKRCLFVIPIEKLLSRCAQSDHFFNPEGIVNATQSFLRAYRKLQPQPYIDPDFLVLMGKLQSCTQEVLSILEHQYHAIERLTISDHAEGLINGIRACFQSMGELGLDLAVVQRWSKQPQTKYVLSLDIHGLVTKALNGYEKLVCLSESHEVDNEFQATNMEMNVWEDRWLQLQNEMGQVKVAAEFASSKQKHEILMGAAWKVQDWDMLEKLNCLPEILAFRDHLGLTLKTSNMILSISKGKPADVEGLYLETVQHCLQFWRSLPSVANGSYGHNSLLKYFHRLVEFRESGQIMVDTINHSSKRTLPDLQNVFSTWRHRLPNDYDETSDWDDIVNWRTQIFNLITANFQWSEASALSTLHDRPWTIIRMASAARKQGAKEFAKLTLSKISDSSMDVADAFSKLREQILSLYNTDSDLERSGGLNLINTTNLGFFDSSQKSELFRLKAQFLSSLGGRSKANQAFCHAVQVCPTYAKAWISWGGLCSSLGRLAEKQQMEQQVDSETKENPNAKKVAQYLAQAMGCYLEAVNCDSNESSRMHLPKCLWMLVKDGNAPGVLSQTLESRGSLLPCWVWLPWCPQLLTSLYRVEGKATKAILINLAKTYPQALYFPLRSFYLERRDVERSKNSMSSSSQQSSVVHSEELMSFLRRAHATLWSSLEAILEELIVNFRPSYEEELLATISALLERADSQLEISSFTGKDSPDEEEIVAASIAKTLGRIATKFFRESTVDVAPSKRDERSRKTEAFKAKYKTKFEEDFLCLAGSDDKKERIDLEEFLKRLRTWKKMLEKQVSSTPHLFPLIESSQSLAMFSAEAPDLWPMSCDPKSAKKLIERDRTIEDMQSATTTTTSALAAQTAAITAAIAIAHSAAIEGQGGEYGGGSSSIEIPGQYVPNTTSAVDSKPAPELHAKLLRFEPRIRIVARNEQLIRCIGMLGSDGRSHHFLLQFAIPYWTRTDERTVQLCYVFEKLFRRDTMCCRNFLSIQPAPVIPIAQRLRITSESKGRISLDDIFRSRCDELGCETNVIVRYFRYKVKKLLSARINQASSPEETKRLIYQTNIDVLREVCEEHVDNEILLNYIMGRLGSAEKLFQFRRSFSSFLAVNSLMQHAFSVIVRTPSRVVINEFTGQVLSPEFRFCYNNQGLLENQKIPFRMTPNMRACLGPIMIDGRFIPSVTWAASAIKQNVEDIDSIFRLLLRDDIVAWYTSKSMAKSDTKTQELETQLADRVTKNVAIIISKISECSVQKESSVLDTLKSKLINDRVRELVDEASSMEKLSTMESNFQPWL